LPECAELDQRAYNGEDEDIGDDLPEAGGAVYTLVIKGEEPAAESEPSTPDRDESAHAVSPLNGADRAIIDRRKLIDYGLNPLHPVGDKKARVFESVFGCNQFNRDDLLAQI
jgi:hypothetical protein